MKIVTVIEDDRVGLVTDICGLLSRAGIEIRSINVDVLRGRATITLSLSDFEKGKRVLKTAGYNVNELISK